MERRFDVSEVVEIPQVKNGRKVRKVLLTIIASMLSIVVVVVSGVFIYMNSIGINYVETENSDETINENNNNSVYVEELAEDDYDSINMIKYVRSNSDTKSLLYNWYSNDGAHMKSKNVLNILIVGIDASGGEAMKGNSDVMMLASINRKEQKITLCSFLRDSYTYYENNSGNGIYSKINAAFANGGADTLMRAIEKNYKIELDYFVAVDFEAFEKVIEAIDGININLTKAEANEIKSMTGSSVEYGENVLLNGKQALAFARIRRLYTTADVQRTENQRKIINAIIKKSKTLGIADLNNVIQTLGEYIYTDCPSTKMLSLGTNAILGKWYNYQVYSMEAPPESAREAYEGPPWLWIVDYPYSAQHVQKQIFGKSNIIIE